MSSTSPTWTVATSASPHPNQRKNSHEDPCKILEPTRKTIQILEAQRIMAVLEDSIHHLELVISLQQVLHKPWAQGPLRTGIPEVQPKF